MMDGQPLDSLGIVRRDPSLGGSRIEIADGKNGRHDARDHFGFPVAQITFSLHENDKKLIEFGKNKTMEIMRAAGANEIVQEQRYAHFVGGCRMSSTPDAGVCDKFGRTWDVPNLFVMDGSVFPTQGSANPGLTIQSLAARTTDYLISQNDAVFHSLTVIFRSLHVCARSRHLEHLRRAYRIFSRICFAVRFVVIHSQVLLLFLLSC
jgi:hypothetical protein